MKQVAQTIAVLLLAMVGMQTAAQDTIDRPRSNCLFTWPDIDNDKEILDCFNRFIYDTSID